MTAPEERRRTPRTSLHLTVFVKFSAKKTAGSVIRALTKDIGEGGTCLLTEEPIAVGTMLELEILLPDRPVPVVCAGEVMWARIVNNQSASEQGKVENGVKFVTIAPKDKALLLQFSRLNPPPPTT